MVMWSSGHIGIIVAFRLWIPCSSMLVDVHDRFIHSFHFRPQTLPLRCLSTLCLVVSFPTARLSLSRAMHFHRNLEPGKLLKRTSVLLPHMIASLIAHAVCSQHFDATLTFLPHKWQVKAASTPPKRTCQFQTRHKNFSSQPFLPLSTSPTHIDTHLQAGSTFAVYPQHLQAFKMRFSTILGVAGLAVGAAISNDDPAETSVQRWISIITDEFPPTSSYDVPAETGKQRWISIITAAPEVTPEAVRGRDVSVSLTYPMTTTCQSGSTSAVQLAQTSVCTSPQTQSYDTRPCAASFYAWWACAPISRRKSNDFGGTRSPPRFVAQFAPATATSTDVAAHYSSDVPSSNDTSSPWMSMHTTSPTPIHARDESQPGSSIDGTPSGWPYPTRCLGGRHQCGVAAFAAQSTQDLGGSSQRLVARVTSIPHWTQTRSNVEFTNSPSPTDNYPTRSVLENLAHSVPKWTRTRSNVEYTNSPSPLDRRAVAANAALPTPPICSFNRTKGQYDCPTPKTAVPTCSFNRTKGQYDCPTPKAAVPICSFNKTKGEYICPTPTHKAEGKSCPA